MVSIGIRRLLATAAAAVLGCGMAQAQVSVSIVGDVATATIALDDGDGGSYDATLRLEFDQPTNLSAACLGISAEVLDAAAITALDARLPDPLRYELDEDFPVRVVVEPPAACGLSFRNDVVIELTTTELEHVAFSPYRLMKAPVGGAFADITEAIEAGSIRARGRGGRFSEFVLVEDFQQSYATDAGALIEELQDEVDDPDIALAARSVLDADLALVAAAHTAQDHAAALAALATFEADLRGFAGSAVPNEWQADEALVDELGEMITLVAALRFQLSRLEGTP